MKTSLIIPTLNRVYDLTRCLKSINKLTQAFDEIIIVEQGDMDATQLLIEDFKTLSIHLYYHSVKSVAQARNVGIEKAQGELLFFIDDDTELDENYVKVAVGYFASNPEVVGISGRIDDKQITLFLFIDRLFKTMLGLNSFKGKILRSGLNCDVFDKDKIQKTQWITGGHAAYRSKVFAQEGAFLHFNKDFIRWSLLEDAWLSYQVYKYYGEGSLMYVPKFKLIHYDSIVANLVDESALKMTVIYRFIFWYNEIYQGSKFNLICYLYWQIAFMISIAIKLKSKPYTFKYFLKGYIYLAKNWRDIANNKADYNQFILQADKASQNKSGVKTN